MAVCAIVFGVGLAASAYLNLVQAQHASDEKALLKGQITDLTYQIDQDRKSQSSPSPKLTPSPSPSASATAPSASPTVLGSKTLLLNELGVSVTASDPVADLTYAYQPKNGVPTIGFTTASLLSRYPSCVASFLGQISKRAIGVRPNANEHLIKTIASNSYYYISPIVECATDSDGKAFRAKLVAAVSNSVTASLK